MKPFAMALPKSVEEAVAASASSFAESKLLAGGTDLLGELKERTQTPDRVVNLKRIPDLDRIEVGDDRVVIGALTRLATIAESSEIRTHWPALAQTIERSATPQIRNVGTLGGNLCQRVRCWYYRHE
ncbi:MAG: FAD binding domain-containing protein, partial [Planctomycetes bacterium]|nr:FAD binding domain-containing protein [Planctomycetota bacterium]